MAPSLGPQAARTRASAGSQVGSGRNAPSGALLRLMRKFETGDLWPAFSVENLGVLSLEGHISQGPPSYCLAGEAGLCGTFLHENFDVKCGLFVLDRSKSL